MKSPNLGFLSFSEAHNLNFVLSVIFQGWHLKNDPGEGMYIQIDIVNDLIC